MREDVRKALAAAALGQDWFAKAPLVFVFTAVVARTAQRYDERANLYVPIEVGCASENLMLEAAALGLGSVAVGAFSRKGGEQGAQASEGMGSVSHRAGRRAGEIRGGAEMSEIRKVLFTTDFSEISNHALPYAIKMAKIFNAELVMLHAVTLYEHDPNDPDHRFPSLQSYCAELRQAADSRFQVCIEEIGDVGVKIRKAVVQGISPHAAILDFLQGGGRLRHDRHVDARAQRSLARAPRERHGERHPLRAVPRSRRQESGARVHRSEDGRGASPEDPLSRSISRRNRSARSIFSAPSRSGTARRSSSTTRSTSRCRPSTTRPASSRCSSSIRGSTSGWRRR